MLGSAVTFVDAFLLWVMAAEFVPAFPEIAISPAVQLHTVWGFAFEVVQVLLK